MDRRASYGVDRALGTPADAAARNGSSRSPPPGSRPRRVLVDFSSPNIGGDFTAAHLRSTLLGRHVANLHAANGWQVVRANFLGDWGPESVGLLGAGWARGLFGSEGEQEGVGLLDNDDGDTLAVVAGVHERMSQLLGPEIAELNHAASAEERAAVAAALGLSPPP